ncbi:MAG: endonuclease/exonuclease/phosphatase family protein [Myxococcota bacterium]
MQITIQSDAARHTVVVGLSGLLLAGALLGVVGRDHFAMGTLFALARWPTLLTAPLLMGVVRPSTTHLARYVIVALSLAVVIHAVALVFDRLHTSTPEQPIGEGHTAVVLTANLRNIPNRPDDTMRALRDAQADLLVIQEVTPAWASLLEQHFTSTHPHRLYWPHSGGTHGFALLSKWPLTNHELLYAAGRKLPFAQASLLTLPHGRVVHLINVHFLSPSGPLRNERHRLYSALKGNAAVRKRQWEQVQAYIDAHPKSCPSLIVGDLNTLEFEPLHRQVTQTHVDVFRHLNWTPGWTWPVNRTDLPWLVARIDYILASPEIAVDHARVVETGGSDHHMVRAVVQ